MRHPRRSDPLTAVIAQLARELEAEERARKAIIHRERSLTAARCPRHWWTPTAPMDECRHA